MKKNKISKNWINKQHRDLYFKKSKDLGYRSRSSFKLIEIDKKFRFLKKNTYLLDLGSFPGGWSQVAVKKITNGKILAVDIKDMKKINGVSFLKGDLSDINICDKIIKSHGGSLKVESQINQGSCFSLILPLQNV